MPSLLKLAAATLLLSAAPALAETPFDGTWKAAPSSLKLNTKPDRFAIRGGVYSCATCIPAYSVKADGVDHAVAGKDYWDTVAVKVVDDHAVTFTYKKGGKVVGTSTDMVSADGRALTVKSRNDNNVGGVMIESTSSAMRVGTPAAGAHLASGSWQFAPPASVSDAGLTMMLHVDGGMMHMKSATGETLDATIGGPYAANVGDPGKTMTKVDQVDPMTLRLTDMRGGKVVQVFTYMVGTDGMMHGTWTDPRDGSSGGFTATKQ